MLASSRASPCRTSLSLTRLKLAAGGAELGMIGGAVGATIVVRFSGFKKSLEIMHFADITPDVSLLAKVGQSGHSVAEAVAELVDNAIDAAPEGGRIEVEIEY